MNEVVALEVGSHVPVGVSWWGREWEKGEMRRRVPVQKALVRYQNVGSWDMTC